MDTTRSVPPQWKRIIVLCLAALLLQCVLVIFPPSSPSERFHATLPFLWLTDYIYYRRYYSKLRWDLMAGVVVGLLVFLWLLISEQARTLGGHMELSEPFWWLLFLSSICALYNILHTGLTRLLELIPTAKELLGSPQGWWLRQLRQAIAIILFVPYVFTASNIHRFKVANATNPLAACGLKYEDVRFAADEDGVTLSGWFIPRRNSNAAVLLCHGVGANKGNFLSFVPFLHHAGFNVFIFDFRGHGDSAGHTVSFGYYEARDVKGAVRYLRQRREIKHIVACAFSMGASSLLHAIPDLPDIRGVIVDSTFADMTAMAQRQMSLLPFGLSRPMLMATDLHSRLELGLPIASISPRQHIATISPRPLFIIHGLSDTLIPPRQAEINFAAAREPKELWLVPGANHIQPMYMAEQEYQRRVVQFLRRCISR